MITVDSGSTCSAEEKKFFSSAESACDYILERYSCNITLYSVDMFTKKNSLIYVQRLTKLVISLL